MKFIKKNHYIGISIAITTFLISGVWWGTHILAQSAPHDDLFWGEWDGCSYNYPGETNYCQSAVTAQGNYCGTVTQTCPSLCGGNSCCDMIAYTNEWYNTIHTGTCSEGGNTCQYQSSFCTWFQPVTIVSCSCAPGPSAGAPTVSLIASPSSVSPGGSSTLTWTVSGAESCTASGSWSGSKSTSGGSENRTNITTNQNYILTCTNSDGSSQDSATVTVDSSVPSVTYDFGAGTTSPYTSTTVTGTAPLNNVGIRFRNITIGSQCQAPTCGFDGSGFYICDASESCAVRFLRQCQSGSGSMQLLTTLYDIGSGPLTNRTFTNTCSYASAGSYTLVGRIEVFKNNNPSAVGVVDKVVSISANTTPSLPSASCSPTSQTVAVGELAVISGGAGGQSPITCIWSAPGGVPSSSSSCSPFGVSYGTVGSKTVTFNVQAANGTAQCQATVQVTPAPPPPPPGNFNVTVERNGQGKVESNDLSINCGGTCTQTYVENTNIVLTATPAPGWRLTQWGGACAGTPATSNTCNLTVTGNQTVTVRFRPQYLIREF